MGRVPVMRRFRMDGPLPVYLAAGAGLLSALCMSGTALAGTHPGSATVQLKHVSLQSSQGSAVLTLSLSGRVAQHVFRLHDPERLVVDLPDTRRLAPLPSPPAGSVVSAMRSGRNEQRGLRLVLDLSSPMQVQQQQELQPGEWRLRIALQSTAVPSSVPVPVPVPASPLPSSSRERQAPAL